MQKRSQQAFPVDFKKYFEHLEAKGLAENALNRFQICDCADTVWGYTYILEIVNLGKSCEAFSNMLRKGVHGAWQLPLRSWVLTQ
jgi:hypothetical protein